MASGRHRKHTKTGDRSRNRPRNRTTNQSRNRVGALGSAVGVAAFIAASAGAAQAAPISANPGHGSGGQSTGAGKTQAQSQQGGGHNGGDSGGGGSNGGQSQGRQSTNAGSGGSASRAHVPTADPAPQPAASSRTYTVRTGDTLSGIADQYGVSWQRLCEANRIEDCNLILPGQELQVRGLGKVSGVSDASSSASSDQRAVAAQSASRSNDRGADRGASCARPDAAESWIIEHESGGSVHADNPTSSAFGLGQLLLENRVRYASQLGVSPDTTDYCDQLKLFRLYVEERYGSAQAAKSFWLSHNWY